MDYEKSVQFLMEHACPSIIYRVRKEILGEEPDTSEMLELQKQILEDSEVMRIMSLQKEDGWLGGLFHGSDEPESGIRYLCEMGIEPGNTVVTEALKAIELRGKNFDDGCLVRVGKLLDDYNLGGSQMIKACVFAYAGHEEETFVKDQIEEALSGFSYVVNLNNIDEVYTLYKDKLVFKQMVKWPSIYHLRLLAFTKCWRSTDNLDVLKAAIHKLVEFSPLPYIKLLHKGQLIAPAYVFMNDFNPNMDTIKGMDWMLWFHRMEMISRLGIAGEIEEIKSQLQALQTILLKGNGLFKKAISHYTLNKWGCYSGLALENDWKAKGRRICDLTFRSLLILKLSGQLSL